jgi:hypothetical protein
LITGSRLTVRHRIDTSFLYRDFGLLILSLRLGVRLGIVRVKTEARIGYSNKLTMEPSHFSESMNEFTPAFLCFFKSTAVSESRRHRQSSASDARIANLYCSKLYVKTQNDFKQVVARTTHKFGKIWNRTHEIETLRSLKRVLSTANPEIPRSQMRCSFQKTRQATWS